MFESLQGSADDENGEMDRSDKETAAGDGDRWARSTVGQIIASASQVNYALMTSPV